MPGQCPRQFPARHIPDLTTPSQPQEMHAAVSGRKARHRTVVVRVSHVATRPPSASSQMRRLGSFPAQARYIPSGLTARALTDGVYTSMDLTSVPSSREKMRILPSAVPATIPVPPEPEVRARAVTAPAGLVSVRRSSPEGMPRSVTVPSPPAVARILPSGEMAQAVTACLYPRNSFIRRPSGTLK